MGGGFRKIKEYERRIEEYSRGIKEHKGIWEGN